MNPESGSPKRRHILSSINPPTEPDAEPQRKRRRRSRSRDDAHRKDEKREEQDKDDHERRRERRRRREERDLRSEERDDEDKTKPRRSRLKLKDGHRSHRRRHRSRSPRRNEEDSTHTTGVRHGRRREDSAQQEQEEQEEPANPFAFDPLDPDVAFRESLFDALADAEGAEYWESVYGQPVHIYDTPSQQGELERMTEDEYAAYVRQKMWEKTHAGLLEERAKREERKKGREKEDRRKRKLEREMEESLRRGEERRMRRREREAWETYEAGWREWDGRPETIHWPGADKGADVDEKTIRAFLIQGLQLEDLGEKAFTAKLKDERVRWHPDKIQQRAGGTVDEATMRNVTAVFQIIDRLWGELRKV